MTESRLRSILKAITWRIAATFATTLITFMVTRRLTFALYVGFCEFIAKIFLYYAHERAWSITSFGIQKKNTTLQNV